jgi:hypothetical protein
MATRSKHRKNHKEKLEARKRRIAQEKTKNEKLQREFIMNLIKQEQEKGLFNDTPSLNIDGPMIDGPIIDGSMIDGPMIDGPMIDGPMIDGPMIDGPIIDGPIINDTVLSVETETVVEEKESEN